MTKATFYTTSPYFRNRQFDIKDRTVNRDNCLYPLYLLRQKMGEAGIDLSTQDINPLNGSTFVIYNDMPPVLPARIAGQKSYLLALESVAINSDNYDIRKYDAFDAVFTWNDTLVNGKKIHKINYAFDPRDIERGNAEAKTGFACMIANNKSSVFPGELYTERRKAIAWFENNRPDDFELFGAGWDKYLFEGRFQRLNRLDVLTRMLAPRHISYRGRVAVKKDVLKRFRYSLCYENAASANGYITEKLFDAFLAGCVPVYLGAPNISRLVPKNTFIDRREYADYPELYRDLKEMPGARYREYLNSIYSFMIGSQAVPFTAEYFANTIKEVILNA